VGFRGSENPIRRFCVSGFFLPSAKILRQQRAIATGALDFFDFGSLKLPPDPAAANVNLTVFPIYVVPLESGDLRIPEPSGSVQHDHGLLEQW